jgi:hypothetical protein
VLIESVSPFAFEKVVEVSFFLMIQPGEKKREQEIVFVSFFFFFLNSQREFKEIFLFYSEFSASSSSFS